MKINIITSRTGGPAKWGKELAESLRKKGIEAEHKNKLWQILIAPFYQKCDIVHTTIPIFFSIWNKPCVLTLKGEYTIEKRRYLCPYKKTIKRADVITTPSEFLKKRLDVSDAVVIPNALFMNNYKRREHTVQEEVRLITVMNFQFPDKSKGIIKICDEISKIKTKNTIIYDVVGDGPYLSELKNKCKKYGFQINFLGRRKDVPELLSKSDIFLYYSEHDNFPNVYLEAMATGLPVVTNNIGATKEIISNGKDGFIVTEYAKTLGNLISDVKLREKIGKAGLDKVRSNFTWKKVIDKYVKIYKELMN